MKKTIIISAFVVVLLVVGFFLFRNSVSNILREDITFESTLADSQILQPILDSYLSKENGSRITYQFFNDKDYYDNLYSRLSSGSEELIPDVVTIPDSQVLRFQKYLSPLTDNTMTSDEYENTFVGTADFELSGSNGSYYAMPLEIDGLMMIYNKDILSKAGITEIPQNWNELFSITKTINKQLSTGSYTLGIGKLENASNTGNIILAMIQQNRGDLVNIDGSINLKSDNTITAIKSFIDLSRYGIDSNIGKTDLELFKDGKLAILFANISSINEIKNTNISYGVATLPQTIGGDIIYSPQYKVAAVTSKAKDKKAAWDFIKYLTSNDSQKEYLKILKEKNNKVGVSGRIDLFGSNSNDQFANLIVKNENNYKIPKLIKINDLKHELVMDVIKFNNGENSLLGILSESEKILYK